MSEYAPGPWELHSYEFMDRHQGYGIWRNKEDLIASVRGEFDFAGGREEMVATAKLIATAPDMLEALKILLENCPKDDCYDFDNGGFTWESDDYRHAKEFAEKAIAKAEGRQEE